MTRRNARRSPLVHEREELLHIIHDLFPDALGEAYGPDDTGYLYVSPFLEEATALDYMIKPDSGMIEIFRAPSERDRPRERNEYVYKVEPTPSGRFQSAIARVLRDKGFVAYILAEWDGEELIPVQVMASIY